VSERKKSQKGFVAVTLITVLAIALVLLAYATLLSTFTGGEVVVGTVAGDVYYSTSNTTTGQWNATLKVANTSVSWYSRINFTSSYTGKINITWQLEKKGTDWANVTGANAKVITTIVLNGTMNQAVYASSNGLITTNHDWKTAIQTTGNGQYRVKAYIQTTS